MPTHIRSRFSIEELQTSRLSEPFSFTKNCKVLQIDGRPWATPRNFGNLLFDVSIDPQQTNPIQAPEIETQMMKHLIELMQATDAPSEQYERLGMVEQYQLS
jgi:hypothetical protein